MRSLSRVSTVCLALALAIGAAGAAIGDDSAVKLQGKGARRDALTAMSYKPYDFGGLGKLESWTGGAAPTKETTKGKPVLIVLWASFYKTSYGALVDAQKLADKNKDLIVVGVHHHTRYPDAAAVLASNKITFPTGHDADGEFFKSFRVDAVGPNLFLVDRAGNLRFADIDKSSLEEAVKIVVGESAEDAAKAEGRAKEAEKSKGDAPLAGPDVKARPDAEAYKTAAWPKVNRQVEHAKNVQGKTLPVALGKETWITPKPDMTGKVVVLDFWATWCGPCVAASPMLDDLQDKYKEDLTVVGMSGQGDDMAKVKTFLKGRKSSYSHAFDAAQGVYKSLVIVGIPHVVVMSTDGVIRWQGNPLDPEFTTALEKVMKADPWVAVRTKAKKG